VLHNPLHDPLGYVLPIERDVAQCRNCFEQFPSEENDAALSDLYDQTPIPVISRSPALPLDDPRIARVGVSQVGLAAGVGSQILENLGRPPIAKSNILAGSRLVAIGKFLEFCYLLIYFRFGPGARPNAVPSIPQGIPSGDEKQHRGRLILNPVMFLRLVGNVLETAELGTSPYHFWQRPIDIPAPPPARPPCLRYISFQTSRMRLSVATRRSACARAGKGFGGRATASE